jgi:hypothetical protein
MRRRKTSSLGFMRGMSSKRHVHYSIHILTMIEQVQEGHVGEDLERDGSAMEGG